MQFAFCTSHPSHPAFTLTELLIAITLFGLVIAMIGIPLLSGMGFVKKVNAKSEAQQAGARALQAVANELEQATYVYDLPPDGSYVSFLQKDPKNEQVTYLRRFAHLSSFPWQKNGNTWALAEPFYRTYPAYPSPASVIYSDLYDPFHNGGTGNNPYILGRLHRELPNDVAWADIEGVSGTLSSANGVPLQYDGSYPLNTNAYTSLLGSLTNKNTLSRQLRNDLTAQSPTGSEWDVPTFKVTPMRVQAESLPLLKKRQPDGATVATTAVGRYPWWAGRNLDVDALIVAGTDATELPVLFGRAGITVNRGTLNTAITTSTWTDWVSSATSRPLFWEFYALGNAGQTPVNPYGYQVRVFDKNGALVYGITNGRAVVQRHFMEWPPIDREDWDDANPYWTPDDIARQRLEGKLVFAQPMWPLTTPSLVQFEFVINNTTLSAGNPVTLPVPEGWDATNTSLASPPQQLIFTKSGDPQSPRVFKLTQSNPGPGQFAVHSYKDRTIVFGEDIDNSSGAQWEVSYDDARKCQYLISDLRPDDIVEVTYSTRSVLDVALTVTRQDLTVTNSESLRQDFKGNTRVAVRTAARGAKSE